MNIMDILKGELESFKFSKDILTNSANHIRDEPWLLHTKGRWYEYIIYEAIVNIAKKTNGLKVARKGRDMLFTWDKTDRPENGLHYNPTGDFVIWKDMICLAEYDIIIANEKGDIGFIETCISKERVRDLRDKIPHKRELLKEYIGQDEIPFMLVTPFDASNLLVTRKILENGGTYCYTSQILDLLNETSFLEAKNKLSVLVDLTELVNDSI